MEVERRSYELMNVEVRSLDDGRISFRGLAATYDSWSKDLGGFVERVTPTAFARAIDEGQDVPFLVNHDKNLFLGRTGTGTVKLRSAPEGLWVEAESLPDTQAARDLKALGGEVRSMSFGFRVPQAGDSWDWKANPAQRSLVDVDLRDVSVLTGATPAYNETTAEVRALLEQRGLRAVGDPAGAIEWDSEDGSSDWQSDVQASLADVFPGSYPWVNDISMDGSKALVCCWMDGASKTWVVPLTVEDGDPRAGPFAEWVEVDQQYVASAARELGRAISDFESRAGAVLSSQSKQRVTDAMQAMRDAHSHLETLMTEAGDTPMHASENDADGIIEDQASLDARLAAARSREQELFRRIHSPYAAGADTESVSTAGTPANV